MQHSPYRDLLKDKDFRRWIRNVERGSSVMGYEYLRRIGYICGRFRKTPQDFAKMSVKQATDFLLDMVEDLEKEKFSGSYVSNLVKALRNWMEFNDVQITKRIQVQHPNQLVKVGDEQPPRPEEFRAVLNAADLRAKTACSIVGFAGQRLEVLGDYLGKDGLKLKDIPELNVTRKTATFEKTPAKVKVRPELSKNKRGFLTFLCDEGCEYTTQYLDYRLQRGEKLGPESPLITPSQSQLAGKHIRTTNIGDLIRKPIRAAGLTFRPYNLRRYFTTQLMLAEQERLIIKDWRVFWSGHTGDIQHTYTLNKGLSDEVIEKMRSAYGKAASRFLVTSRRETDRTDLIAEISKRLLGVAGYSEAELSDIDLGSLTDQDVQQMVRKKLFGTLAANGARTLIVSAQELEDYLRRGYDYVDSPPALNGRSIIRFPN